MINTVQSSTSLVQANKAQSRRAEVAEQKDIRAGTTHGFLPRDKVDINPLETNRAIQKAEAADAQKAMAEMRPANDHLKSGADVMQKVQQQKEALSVQSSTLVQAYQNAEKLKQTETAVMPESAKAIVRKTEADKPNIVTVSQQNEAAGKTTLQFNSDESQRIEQEAQSAHANDALARSKQRLDAQRYEARSEPVSNKVDRTA